MKIFFIFVGVVVVSFFLWRGIKAGVKAVEEKAENDMDI